MNKLVRFCILALLVPLSGFSATKICDDSRANIMNVDTNGNIASQFVNENGNALGVDLITRCLMTVDYAHHEIHAGSTFRVQHNDDAIPATGSDGELVIAFYVPDQSKQPHMTWETSHEGNMTVTLYEGITLATNGTARSIQQSNRNSANTSILQGFATGSGVSNTVTVGEESADSIYSGGTAISLKRDYSTRNVSGSQVRRNEVILKTDEYYAFSLKNHETSTQGGQIRLEWYEHQPRTD
jgi:hypothetical protein